MILNASQYFPDTLPIGSSQAANQPTNQWENQKNYHHTKILMEFTMRMPKMHIFGNASLFCLQSNQRFLQSSSYIHIYTHLHMHKLSHVIFRFNFNYVYRKFRQFWKRTNNILFGQKMVYVYMIRKSAYSKDICLEQSNIYKICMKDKYIAMIKDVDNSQK